jgi:hypothetical protein
MEGTPRRLGRAARAATCAAAVVWAAAAFAVPAWAAEPVAITAAEWRPDRSILQIEGTATKPDEVVLVRDAGTRALLGSAAVRADGKWMLKIRDPSAVPTRARAELGKQCVECDVTGPAMAR